MAIDITHDVEAQRYVLSIDSVRVSTLDYRTRGDKTAIVHTYTSPAERGNGYAAQLTAYAVDDIAATTVGALVASCPFVASWFAEHEDKSDLLTRSPNGA